MAHLIHEDLSRELIAAAMKVHGTLRPGLDEKLYEMRSSSNSQSAVIAQNSRRVSPFITMGISSGE